MNFEDRKVVFDSTSIIENGRFIASCNTLNLLNTGTTTVYIDSQIRLLPNMGYEFVCWPNELNIKTYEVTFDNGGNTALFNRLVITRKIYQDAIAR